MTGSVNAQLMPRAAVGLGDPTLPDMTPTDADLAAAGLDPNAISTPADRATAVQAFNEARQTMARAKAGQTANAVSGALGAAVLVASVTFPPAAIALGLLAAFWAGSIAAMQWIGNVIGWARSGLGVWTEWLNSFPPQGTGVADGDANWFNPESGYKPGAHTPWTVHDSNYIGEAATLGLMSGRIATADTQGAVVGAFARFALPLLYRAYELAMNGRLRSSDGYGLYPDGGAYSTTDGSCMYIGCRGVPAFDAALKLWNSQHPGPAIQVTNTMFPYAPGSFSLNTGPLSGTQYTTIIGGLRTVAKSTAAPSKGPTAAEIAIAVPLTAAAGLGIYSFIAKESIGSVVKHIWRKARGK